VELSPREREILHWVGEGKRNAEIATILQLSPLTVRKHLENIFSKLGVETRTAAAAALRDTPAN
jgi:DNA-binding CsgD family transcriptional regulator